MMQRRDSSKAEFGEPPLTASELNAEMLIILLPVTIVIGIEAVIGCVGNILILIVYSKWYSYCNFRYFVLCLAVCDLTSCVTTLPGEIFSLAKWYHYPYDVICKIKSYFHVLTAWASAFTLFLLAIDRYRKVCKPLKRQIKPGLALKLCILGVFLASVISVPVTILWGKQTYTYTEGNRSADVSICEIADEYVDDVYSFVYTTCIYVLLLGPMMIVICIVNILIARTLFCRRFDKSAGRVKIEDNHLLKSVSNRFIRFDSHLSVRKTVRNKVHRDSNGYSADNNLSSDNEDIFTVSLKYTSHSEMSMYSSSELSVTELNVFKYNQSHVLEDINQICVQTTESRPPTSDSKKTDIIHTSKASPSNAILFRRRRKTLIMLILSSVFVFTVTVYFSLISLLAGIEDFTKRLSNTEFVVYMFFLRLYFINCIINPLLYGFLDPRFRKGLKRIFSFHSKRHARHT